VADAVAELGQWEQHGATIGDVLDALERLRRAADRTATRTSVVTLVAVADDDEAREQACDTTATLGVRHPGRTIVVQPVDDDGPGGIDARVRLLEGSADGVRIWSEELTLVVRGPASGHLDSLIEPLALPDPPLAVWYVDRRPSADDPLCDAADVVLIDSKEVGDAAGFAETLEIARNRTVIDLSWVRLTPWRLLLAGLFEGRVYRPYATRITGAEVRGKPGVRDLLGGWLASRLQLDDVRLEDAKHASMRLIADGAEFVVGRHRDERMVRAAARIDGGPGHEELLALPDMTLAWSLTEALSDLESDEIYSQSLEAALSFAR
jgi:glucose-6-phosphate dehydrogenase assembly protein OpcA